MLIYQMLNMRSNAPMDMHQFRRDRLQELIATRFKGDRKLICDACGYSESRIAQLLSSTYRGGHGFGEKAARALETVLGLEQFYFDKGAANSERSPSQVQAENSVKMQYNAGPEEDVVIGRYVAIVGIGRGGPDGYFSVDDYAPGDGDGYIYTYSRDPVAYAIRVRGDSMRPRIKSGEYIVAEPTIESLPGDDVVVKLKDGNALVKELLWIRDDEVSLGSINNGIPPITIPLKEIQSIHRVAAIVPRGSALLKPR